MKQIHIQEKQQFKKLFKQEHIDDFENRFKVLEVFLQTEKHVSIGELFCRRKQSNLDNQVTTKSSPDDASRFPISGINPYANAMVLIG